MNNNNSTNINNINNSNVINNNKTINTTSKIKDKIKKFIPENIYTSSDVNIPKIDLTNNNNNKTISTFTNTNITLMEINNNNDKYFQSPPSSKKILHVIEPYLIKKFQS